MMKSCFVRPPERCAGGGISAYQSLIDPCQRHETGSESDVGQMLRLVSSRLVLAVSSVGGWTPVTAILKAECLDVPRRLLCISQQHEVVILTPSRVASTTRALGRCVLSYSPI